MLRLLADENIPERLVMLLKKNGVDAVRLQNISVRDINDQELIGMTTSLGDHTSQRLGPHGATPSIPRGT